jgi:hypothetical protein
MRGGVDSTTFEESTPPGITRTPYLLATLIFFG